SRGIAGGARLKRGRDPEHRVVKGKRNGTRQRGVARGRGGRGHSAMETSDSSFEAIPEPDRSWSIVERAAWKLLTVGRTVDLRGTVRPDPKLAEDWTPERRRTRRLSPIFLRAVLTLKPWCGTLRPEGIRILGAIFEDGIDLAYVTVACPVQLEAC